MLATIMTSCGMVWWLVFGCADESHIPVTNTIIQTNQQHEQTEQERIRAGTERAAIQATASAHNGSVRAAIAVTEADAERQRNYDTQIFLSDRFAWEERAKTERQFNLIVLLASIVITGGIVAVIWIMKGHPGSAVRNDLPSVSAYRFKQEAEQVGWEDWQVYDDGEKLIGEAPDGKQWLLTEG